MKCKIHHTTVVEIVARDLVSFSYYSNKKIFTMNTPKIRKSGAYTNFFSDLTILFLHSNPFTVIDSKGGSMTKQGSVSSSAIWCV